MKILAFLLVTLLVCPCALGYVVRRNVKDYGARGDGRTDDTAAIILALTEGRGDDPNAKYPTTYSENTVRAAYVYFPPGTYLVSQPLPVIYYTQVVGDAVSIPTIKFVSGQSGLRVLEVAGGWYPGANQNNFYRQIRNLIIDMTSAVSCTGVHWQVAQATSITNVYFKSGVGTRNQGMWMENGSGGFISDIVFDGGIYGMWVGNQQFTSRNITIRDVSIAGIYLNWDWVWTFQNLQITNAPVGVDIAIGIGSAVIIDSHFNNVAIGVRTLFAPATNGKCSLLIDNLVFVNNQAATIVADSLTPVLKANAGTTTVKSWVQGSIWASGQVVVTNKDISSSTPARPSVLVQSDGTYFGMTRPLYLGQTIVNVNTLGIYGNSSSDITSQIQSAINQYANKAVLFFPHDIYHISSTVNIIPGTRIVGEAWSVFMASGQAFQNAANPVPMFQVGQPGQQGVAQLQDLIFSTYGPQPGATLIEWNLHDPANAPGSTGMWDVHFRIGGAVGTNINPNNCPSGDGGRAPASACTGAWALMHLTKSGSCYLENVWGWTADHDIDAHSQINVYNTRGFLCESQGPVWLYGTAMEHNVLYQYNFNGAKNVFMGAIQTETPYYQPSTKTPFARSHATDPTFCSNDPRCNMSYGLVLINSADIWLYSAGLYSFFEVWDQTCLGGTGGSPACQINMVQIQSPQRVHIYALATYGSVYMLSTNEPYSKASLNNNTFCAQSIVDLNLF